MSVTLIDPAQERANGVIAELERRVTEAGAESGPNLAGFALVTWDMRGEMRSAYLAADGPFAPSLVPTAVHDALNRHLAVVLAKEASLEESGA